MGEAASKNRMINRSGLAHVYSRPFSRCRARNSTMLENEEPPVTGRGDILSGIYTLSSYDNKRDSENWQIAVLEILLAVRRGQ